MDGSAGTVGRIMAALLGVPERHRADFGRLGQAFQLTNFLRDVREDRASTASTCRRDRAASASPTPTSTARRRRRSCARPSRTRSRRARDLFDGAEAAVAAAPASVRPGIRIACAVYRGVLDRIEAIDFDVLGAPHRGCGRGSCRRAALGALRG